MTTLKFFLFGRFQIWCGGKASVCIDNQKVQELLAYLLLFRDRAHPRETLANLLWDNGSTGQIKKYLRHTLWQLQVALNAQTESSNCHLLLVEPDWVQINTEADFWCDVVIFDQAFTLFQDVPGHALDDQSVEGLQNAVHLYRGDLLAGWYQDWCLQERERLQSKYLAMLDKLITYCQAHQRYEEGLTYGSHILNYDQARERTHRQLMRLQYLSGDRTTALHQYERCVAILDEQLGVKPAKKTLALYEQIRSDQLHDPLLTSSGTDLSPQMATLAPILSEILDHLKHFTEVLDDLQSQTEREIQVIEQILKN